MSLSVHTKTTVLAYRDLTQKYYYHGRLIDDRQILVSKNLVNNTLRVKQTCFSETGIKNILNILNVERTK